jgi:hypothetical protein
MQLTLYVHGFAAAVSLLLATSASAQAPLNIDALLVEARRWQLAAAMDYASAVPVPGIEERFAGATLAVRYGLRRDLEVNARWRTRSRQLQALPGDDRSVSEHVGMGINWQLKEESATPAVIVEARADMRLRGAGEQPRHAAQILLTAYQSFEPVVVSLTASVDVFPSYAEAAERIRPGANWSLVPQVNFSVNHRVTLIGGLTFNRREETTIAGRPAAPSQERVGARAGLAFAPGGSSRVFLFGDYGAASGSVSLQWLYRF